MQQDNIQFTCDCSDHKMRQALLLAGKNTVGPLLENDEVIEVCCDFCGSLYHFDPVEVQDIFLQGFMLGSENETVH